MEIVQLIILIGIILILAASIVAAVYAVQAYHTAKDPRTYIIEGDEEFAGKLYEDFASRLVTDPIFVKKAKEAVAI